MELTIISAEEEYDMAHHKYVPSRKFRNIKLRLL